MRVLHVLPSVSRAYGGPTQSLLGFSLAALTAGVDIDIATPDPGATERAWWAESLPRRLTLFPSVGQGAFVASPHLLWWLWREGGRFDVVHIHALQNPVSSLAASICRQRGWPFIVRPLGMLSEFTFTHRRQRAKKLYFAALDRPNLRSCAGIHFTTDGEREEGLRRVHDLDLRTFVVPPPWKGELVSPARASRPQLLFLSRLHPVKNIEALLRAWPRVVRTVPDAELVLAGDGEPDYVSALRTMVATLDIGRSVRFVGFVTGQQKLTLLSAAHASLLISFHENFGVAALEAMAAGLPLVLSPTVHLAPFAHRHGLAIVADPADSDALSRALVTALTDPAMRAHCERSGPELSRREFSVETIGRRLLAMYEEARA